LNFKIELVKQLSCFLELQAKDKVYKQKKSSKRKEKQIN